jgi:lipopolysaccharide heptosyltransferase I
MVTKLYSRILQKQSCRILIIKPSSLGDILHLFPALELLKRFNPTIVADFVINPEFSPLLDYSPLKINKRIFFERKKLGKINSFIPELYKLVKNLRAEKYDIVLDFQGLLRSALISSLVRTKNGVVGFANPREHLATYFYSRRVLVPVEHAVKRNARLVNAITATVDDIPVPQLPSYQEHIPQDLPEKYIVLLPGARWPSKCFPTKLFADIAMLVSEKLPDYSFVVAGANTDYGRAEQIKNFLPEGFPVINYCGKTTMQGLFELLNASSACVCNDSGPLHIASMLSKKIYAFYGSTRPELTGPWGQARVYQTMDKCLGCLKRECPYSLECHMISPELVANDILEDLTTIS